jgi:hypothetical protein
MKNSQAYIFAILLLCCTCATAQTLSRPFSIKTSDGITAITGVVEIPTSCEGQKCPAILMVGGTGLFDKDYDFGNSNTNDDFLFKKLASRINKKNIVTIRYDYRGVKCSMKTAPPCDSCKSELEIYISYYQHCVDPLVRAKVTPETIRDDIVRVYEYARNQENIDQNQFAILAHSEGTLHTSRLIANKRISPTAMIMLGMMAESPKEIIHWQSVDRNVDSIFKYDTNHNGVIELNERKQYCTGNEVMSERCDEIIPTRDKLDRATVVSSVEQAYLKAVDMVLMTPDSAPFPGSAMPMASMAWWKMFYTDNLRPLNELSGYQGKISFNNGDIDTQTPGIRELPIVFENKSKFKQTPHINLLYGVGHGFGKNGTVGPMTENSIQQILEEIEWLFQP